MIRPSSALPLAGRALIAALVGAFVIFLLFTGGKVDTKKDDGYLAASEIAGWEHRLAHQRTFGYPLFLRSVRAISPDLAILPFLQAGIFLGALGALYLCLREAGMGAWAAFFGTVPIAANNLLLPMAQRVLTDTVAVSVAMVAMGTLLGALAAPNGKRWILFATVLFLAYQVRPVYVFLVPLAPVLAMLLRTGAWRQPWRRALSTAGWVTTLAFVPLLSFCLLRLIVVGHFGLVSFGGFNLVGIAASLLSKSTVAGLPADLRPLAQTILEQRTERGLKPVQERRVDRFPGARQKHWYREFDPNVWQISGRAAFREAFARYEAEHPKPDEKDVATYSRWKEERRIWSNVEADRRLLALSVAVLSQHGGLYASWVARGLKDGLRWTFGRVRGVTVCALALLAAFLAFWLRALPKGRRGRAEAGRALAASVRSVWPLWCAGSAFYAAHLLLIVLVERPQDRYVQAVAVFLPGMFLALAWELWTGTTYRAASDRPAEADSDLDRIEP